MRPVGNRVAYPGRRRVCARPGLLVCRHAGAVAAFLLGAIQRTIGAPEHGLEVAINVPHAGHAEARGDAGFRIIRIDPARGHQASDPLRQRG